MEEGRKGPDNLSSWKFLLGNILLSNYFLFSGFFLFLYIPFCFPVIIISLPEGFSFDPISPPPTGGDTPCRVAKGRKRRQRRG